MPIKLTPERGLLFRITHRDNLPWLLANGIHCADSAAADPHFVAIGNPDLIRERARCPVPLSPGGTLANYVPFYFTPKSLMLFNIKTGYNGVVRRSNEDIVVLISSCAAMTAQGVSLIFTDRHAYAATASWRDSYDAVKEMIDWDILCRHDFARDDFYPDKKERYQAEALAHDHVPPQALLGIGCVSESVQPAIKAAVNAAGLALEVFVRPTWYF